MPKLHGLGGVKCKHCHKQINLAGTPAQIVFRIKMHFETGGHTTEHRSQVDELIKSWERLSDREKEERVIKLVREHFV
jgi:hypothetical protein